MRAEEGQARMAATDVKGRCTTVLWADGIVSIPTWGRMSQMALGHEMSGALQDLGSPGHHGQGQRESTDLGAPDIHRIR